MPRAVFCSLSSVEHNKQLRQDYNVMSKKRLFGYFFRDAGSVTHRDNRKRQKKKKRKKNGRSGIRTRFFSSLLKKALESPEIFSLHKAVRFAAARMSFAGAEGGLQIRRRLASQQFDSAFPAFLAACTSDVNL